MSAPPTEAVRVGAGGFTGSSITEWCDGCEDYTVPSDGGRCLWCDARVFVHLLGRECAGCGEPFQPNRTEQRYCNLSCSARANSSLPRVHRGRVARVEAMGDRRIRDAHRRYIDDNVSLLDLAFEQAPHDYYGYRTASDLAQALRTSFRRRGLPVRDCRGGAVARHSRDRVAA